MQPRDHPHWPRHLPHRLTPPEGSLYEQLATSARRYPRKSAFIFYGAELSFSALKADVDALAGFLQRRCSVERGDRVLLQMQNCPQFVVAFYAVQRLGAVAVPANPMYRRDELAHLIEDTGARVAISARDTAAEFASLRAKCPTLICIDYRDALLGMPVEAIAPALLRTEHPLPAGAVAWSDALGARCAATPPEVKSGDLCMLLYSSGSTGRPKGCMHTHQAMATIAAAVVTWMGIYSDSVLLMTVPLFHIAGMQNMMIAPVSVGATVVISARWDRDTACILTDRHAVTHWTLMPTMVIDLLAHPRLDDYRLDTVCRIGGGGASMPDAVAVALERRWGLRYLEGYGLSETGHVLSNPPQHAKRQCLGIPLFGVDVRLIDPDTGAEAQDQGEIVLAAPYLFVGYWNRPDDTAAAFFEHDGKRFFRTGDIGRVDQEGYYFLVDRLKRMVNASGFKVWPSEIEAMLHAHPAVLEACVIAALDPHRGETVKAVIALKTGEAGQVSAEDIVAWARERMAAFKVPRLVQFVDQLPKTATGKVDWRQLQDIETPAASNR